MKIKVNASMLLLIFLIILKLSGDIELGWLWVFFPVWLPLVIIGCLTLIAAVCDAFTGD